MMNNTIMIYGNGGHGRVVEDLIKEVDSSITTEYFDANGRAYDLNYNPTSKLVIAVGNNEVREKISTEVSHEFTTLIHSTASIGRNVVIGEGSVVLANAVIQNNAVIGKHCIINANVTIDHDAIIEDFVCTYPSSYVAGFARVTKGQTLLPGQVVWKSEVL